eukprot:scaffold4216_cov146-Amphora_coffeaeformis.AAC.3
MRCSFAFDDEAPLVNRPKECDLTALGDTLQSSRGPVEVVVAVRKIGMLNLIRRRSLWNGKSMQKHKERTDVF